MAATRERRHNAGNKMSTMLDDEEDDCYKTLYGGFDETNDDQDYVQKNEEDDVVDSDFSIDENDAPVSDPDGDADAGRKRKRKPLSTRAYREPAAKKAKTTASTSAAATASTSKQPPKSPTKTASVKKTPAAAADRTATYTVMDSGECHRTFAICSIAVL